MSWFWRIMGMGRALNMTQIMLVWLVCTTQLISKEAKTLGSTKVTKSQVIKRLGSKVRFNPWEDRISKEKIRAQEAAHPQVKEITITSRQMTIDIQKSFHGAPTHKDSLVWDLNWLETRLTCYPSSARITFRFAYSLVAMHTPYLSPTITMCMQWVRMITGSSELTTQSDSKIHLFLSKVSRRRVVMFTK